MPLILDRSLREEKRRNAKCIRRKKWARLDLNQGPRDYESPALTAELRALFYFRSASHLCVLPRSPFSHVSEYAPSGSLVSLDLLASLRKKSKIAGGLLCFPPQPCSHVPLYAPSGLIVKLRTPCRSLRKGIGETEQKPNLNYLRTSKIVIPTPTKIIPKIGGTGMLFSFSAST